MPHRIPNVWGSAATGVLSTPSDDDPYRYQLGFGNHHISEAIPGALPRHGTNLPQRCEYDLVAEHLNGTSFISSRDSVKNVWMYRIRPSSAHTRLSPLSGPTQIESCFLPTNPRIDFTPLSHTWGPLDGPDSHTSGPTTFVEGLKTIGGHGDPTLKEGLAVHQYAFNANMERQAFANNDGDLLIVPQKGILDIQTEMGFLRVPPGAIAVVPAGIRFRVLLGGKSAGETAQAGGGARGYAIEIFGTHFALPELGPIGGNGLAHVRDFEYPVASFELDPPVASFASSSPEKSAAAATAPPPSIDNPPWQVILKLSGHLFTYTQPHTPFDVVAWHGRYAPFKYLLSRFVSLTVCGDQLDPTAYCVLTAPSKWPGVSLIDFCVIGEKWLVAKDTYRLPYHHRTMATEMGGVIKGTYKGSVRPLAEGGLSFEQAYMPHGETWEVWKRDQTSEQGPVKVEGYLGFFLHISSHMALTKWAREEHPGLCKEKEGVWDSFFGHTIGDLNKANERLQKAGAQPLDATDVDEKP